MDKPLVQNAADPAQVRAAGKKEKTATRLSQDAWFNLLSQSHGRRAVWELLEYCGLLNNAWRSSEELQYLTGKKAVASWVVSKINDARPGAFIEMMKEAEERKGI